MVALIFSSTVTVLCAALTFHVCKSSWLAVYSRGYYGNASTTTGRGQRRGWGRGRGQGRGVWRGGARPASREQLDAQLDQYMTSAD